MKKDKESGMKERCLLVATPPFSVGLAEFPKMRLAKER